ncbi:hypothetical protein ABMA28_011115 [Loxostege sticticalis]|uniref:Uncharacterized protein n=1 Tax=Loxostege sticticalis TaxID=481309 RepID=A0ABD0S6S4_LOXSC
MKTSAVFVVCCLCFVQNAFSQAVNVGNIGLVETGLNSIGNTNYNNLLGTGNSFSRFGSGSSVGVPDVSAYAQLPVTGQYGGTGTGELTAAGEFTASGNTVVTGQVPVIGTVRFSGSIPASGVVSIAGNCGCANAL